MLPILQSVVAIGVASAMAAVRRAAVRRAAVTVAGLLVAAALLVTSLGFFTVAAYRTLSHSLGDVPALLIVGCAYLVASLVALLIVQFKQR
jgi:hypothetical protein